MASATGRLGMGDGSIDFGLPGFEGYGGGSATADLRPDTFGFPGF